MALALIAFACNETREMSESATSMETVTQKNPGITLAYMDKDVRPQDDFYKFVNGTWMKNNVIPEDRTRWGSFDELSKKTDEDALKILKKATMSGNYSKGTDQWKAIEIYRSVMDLDSRNKKGLEPLMPYLNKIDAVTDMASLQDLIVEMQPLGGVGFFGMYVYADMMNSNLNVGYLGGGQLGLPERDYYMAEDEESEEIRKKYVAHVTRMLQYLGDSEADAADRAERVLAFETRLAKPLMTKEERRDARKRYNPRNMTELGEMCPSIKWASYFTEVGAGVPEQVIVSNPAYFETLQEIFNEGNVAEWKNYMRWAALNSAAGLLSEELDMANWEFYSKELRGALEQRPLEERALSTLNGTAGEALGKLYVDEMFPPEAKAKAEKMVANVLDAYKVRINNLTWMAAETKAKAIEKIEKLNVKIAYPDKWKDYSKMEITSVEDGGSYFQNMINVGKWNYYERMGKLNKAVDKTEWFMPPQQVNAYYNPSYNEIVFPAAILQPPFYNHKADMAVNYGGIGAVIGHEVSHGFDDSGARFDADGNLNNWWTDDDLTEFTELGKALIAQYDALSPIEGFNVNGEFTLGENIGDLGGVFSAYDGLQMHLSQAGNPGDIDGYSQEQRFFLSWATVWRQLIRDEALKTRLKTDPHSPGQYRGYVPIINMDEFHAAWDTKPGDPMYLSKEERVQIW